MKFKLIVTNPADQDLNEIAQYIAKDLSAPIAASDFLDEVSKCYDNISEYPLMYPPCQQERLRDKGYRKAVINNYLLLYRVEEENKVVYIMRCFYGGMDYEKLI